MGVDAWGVEEGKAQICGSVKVWRGLSFLFRGEEPNGLVAKLWMLKSPATRYTYSRSKRDDSGQTECGAGGSGLASELPILKQGSFVPKQPCGGKTSSAIKLSVSRGKNGSTTNSCRNFWDT